MIELYDHQRKAIEDLKNGRILVGGVGSGKSRTAIGYFYMHECGGTLRINGDGETGPLEHPRDLYIITTARKRDTREWERECVPFQLCKDRDVSYGGVQVTIDSWNNIGKYLDIHGAFFIFDEQRVIGSGAWVKAFLKIVRSNRWILLSATPGDTWMDYIPVFIANNFYRNRTEFIRRHVVFNRYSKYPKVDRYIEEKRLEKLRESITVEMPFDRPTKSHHLDIYTDYDQTLYDVIAKKRWNPYTEAPIRDASELCYALRKVVNSDETKTQRLLELLEETHSKIVLFYNFDYELDNLRNCLGHNKIVFSEWNGHKHDPVPTGEKWIYLVQYTAGCEGWNCIETNAVVFFSQNYSYKVMAQAAGRIDRLNTPFVDLYYYHFKSKSGIDRSIERAIKEKRVFNERLFQCTTFA